MARRTNNTLAIITWLIGLLGYLGYINDFIFFLLVLPIFFGLFGNKLAKNHIRAYFNVLLTAVIIYFIGFVINNIFDIIKIHTFDLTYLGLIYFAIMCLFGLIAALDKRRYRPILSVKIF